MQHTFNDKKDIPIFSQIFTSDNINLDDNQSTLDVETKKKIDIKMNEIIKQNVVTGALSNKEILDSIILEKIIAQNNTAKIRNYFNR